MCFISPILTKEKTAAKDIVCWKIMRFDLMSLFQMFQYVLGREESIKELGVEKKWNTRVVVNEGFHSIKKFDDARCYIRHTHLEILVKCTIPVGARYYENKNEYVSDKIIPVKKVPFPWNSSGI